MTAMPIPDSMLSTDAQLDDFTDLDFPTQLDAAAPIGLFDSGVGGLSVYQHLKQVLPNERFVYYADTLNVPYGPRSSEEIKQLSLAAVDWLAAAGCKLIVIACNSASAHALKVAREQYPHLPIVGLVPALKPAVLNSQNKKVAVLATKATLDGTLLNQVIDDYANPAGVEVVKWFDPDLVPWVEAGMPLESKTAIQLKKQLQAFAKQQVDYLVLGCTHYPFFRQFISDEIAAQGLDIQVLDSGAAIASRVKEVLRAENKLANGLAQIDAHIEINNSSININVIKSILSSETQLSKVADSDITDTPQLGIENLIGTEPLTFYVTDPEANLDEVASLVHRLLT